MSSLLLHTNHVISQTLPFILHRRGSIPCQYPLYTQAGRTNSPGHKQDEDEPVNGAGRPGGSVDSVSVEVLEVTGSNNMSHTTAQGPPDRVHCRGSLQDTLGWMRGGVNHHNASSPNLISPE